MDSDKYGWRLATVLVSNDALDDVTGSQKGAVRINEKCRSVDSSILVWRRGASAGYRSYAGFHLLDRAYELVGLLSVSWRCWQAPGADKRRNE